MRKMPLHVLGIILALIGLFAAAGAVDHGMFLGGALFCLFGVGLNFWLIAQDSADIGDSRRE